VPVAKCSSSLALLAGLNGATPMPTPTPAPAPPAVRNAIVLLPIEELPDPSGRASESMTSLPTSFAGEGEPSREFGLDMCV
jgi:hypothetical protein